MKYSCCFLLIILFSSNTSVLSEVNDSGLSGDFVLATKGQFPWFVPMEITYASSYNIRVCEGNILSDEWILTAAYAVENATAAKIFPGRTNMEIRAAVTYESREFYVHPNYNPENFNADLGLIKLKTKLCFNKLVQPIKLHNLKLEDRTTVVTIPTWGRNSDTQQKSKILHYIEMAVISNKECTTVFDVDTDTNFCATSGPNLKSCAIYSDGSGAAVYYKGERRLVGLHTFKPSNHCTGNEPLGFIRTYPYMDWIKKITGV